MLQIHPFPKIIFAGPAPVWYTLAAHSDSTSLGFRPIVVLVDDGVYLAKADQNPGQSQWLSLSETLEEIIARGLKKDALAEFYVESQSLLKRSLDPKKLVVNLELIDHQKVSELMSVNRLQLIF